MILNMQPFDYRQAPISAAFYLQKRLVGHLTRLNTGWFPNLSTACVASKFEKNTDSTWLYFTLYCSAWFYNGFIWLSYLTFNSFYLGSTGLYVTLYHSSTWLYLPVLQSTMTLLVDPLHSGSFILTMTPCHSTMHGSTGLCLTLCHSTQAH